MLGSRTRFARTRTYLCNDDAVHHPVGVVLNEFKNVNVLRIIADLSVYLCEVRWRKNRSLERRVLAILHRCCVLCVVFASCQQSAPGTIICGIASARRPCPKSIILHNYRSFSRLLEMSKYMFFVQAQLVRLFLPAIVGATASSTCNIRYEQCVWCGTLLVW